MKIDLDKVSAGMSPLKDSAGQKPSPKPAAEPQAVAGSALQLSDLSSKLKHVESKLVQGDAFDAQRVAQIKQAIKGGTFSVNAEAVADKLIANAYEVLGKLH
ncbi:MAG: flagellar biosynthesis anti-sigma factor FlgM [Betaproteobacteria bacterium]|nr:flagellar biosynthesis anti-sigma factor FlgM [Betaproteobacteria bacterium]